MLMCYGDLMSQQELQQVIFSCTCELLRFCAGNLDRAAFGRSQCSSTTWKHGASGTKGGRARVSSSAVRNAATTDWLSAWRVVFLRNQWIRWRIAWWPEWTSFTFIHQHSSKPSFAQQLRETEWDGHLWTPQIRRFIAYSTTEWVFINPIWSRKVLCSYTLDYILLYVHERHVIVICWHWVHWVSLCVLHALYDTVCVVCTSFKLSTRLPLICRW